MRGNVLSESEILAKKIADRCCRRNLRQSEGILEIVNDCSADLGMEVPEVICCETLTRSLSAFYFRKNPYLIYDSCLLEALYIFDHICLLGSQKNDMKKFFFKLIGEEFIRNGNLQWSLYFSGKYRTMEYLFEKDEGYDSHTIHYMLSAQSYFLIGHELGHLAVGRKQGGGVPEDYHKFVRASMRVLDSRILEDCTFEQFIKERYGYFIEKQPTNIEKYYNELFNSQRFQHFIEECYCDWNGVKLLLEHYNEPEKSISAISHVFNYLILQEAIRSDITADKLFFENADHPVSRAMYFSVLRMEILLLAIQFNKLEKIEDGFRKVQEQFGLMNYWLDIIRDIPSYESFCVVDEKSIQGMDRKKLTDSLINCFYYAHIE